MSKSSFKRDEVKLEKFSVKEASDRIYRLGIENLSDAELTAALIRNSKASWKLISEFEHDLHRIAAAGADELAKVIGIGRAKAEMIMAGFELGKRLQIKRKQGALIKEPGDVARLVMPEMRHLEQEYFKVMSLNQRNRVLAISTVAVGTLNAALVHPREVFKEALHRTAAAIILIHNHPSGDPTPSDNEDIEITKRIAKAGKILGIEMLDHIIIGDGEFVSMKNKGLL